MNKNSKGIEQVVSFWRWVEAHQAETIPNAILEREKILANILLKED